VKEKRKSKNTVENYTLPNDVNGLDKEDREKKESENIQKITRK